MENLDFALKPFSDSQLKTMAESPTYARAMLAKLARIDLTQLDLATKNAILVQIKIVQSIVDEQSKITPSHDQKDEAEPKETEEPKINTQEKSDEEIIAEKIIEAQDRLRSEIIKNIKEGKIIAVDENGDEIKPEFKDGKPSNIKAIAGNDQSAIEEIASRIDEIYQNFQSLGFIVRRQIVKEEGKDPMYFNGVIMPKGYENCDPLTMTKDQIIAASEQLKKELPPTTIATKINQNNETDHFARFKNLVQNAVAVAKGDAQEVAEFRNQQIVEWWQELTGREIAPSLPLKQQSQLESEGVAVR